MMKLSLSLGLAVALIPNAFAEKIGNGGGAWVCRSANGTLKRIELVDLFEAAHEFKLERADWTGDVSDLIERAAAKVRAADPRLADQLDPYLARIGRLRPDGLAVVHTDDRLAIVGDSFPRLEPGTDFCPVGKVKYEQVVNYKHDQGILVQRALFLKLDAFSRAALVFHEALYALRRDLYGDDDSVETRRLVGRIFSTETSFAYSREWTDLENAFVKIAGGSFATEYGSGGRVTVTKAFEIQKTEVTQKLFFEVVGLNPSHFSRLDDCPTKYLRLEGTGICPDRPVENVTYEMVETFLKSLNDRNAKTGFRYRLPTEAEWELAAQDALGKDGMDFDHYSWHLSTSKSSTHSVAGLRPSLYGLFDMIGNVAEFVAGYTWDQYPGTGSTPGRTVKDPAPLRKGTARTVRGGSYTSTPILGEIRTRSSVLLDESDRTIGFRLVRDAI